MTDPNNPSLTGVSVWRIVEVSVPLRDAKTRPPKWLILKRDIHGEERVIESYSEDYGFDLVARHWPQAVKGYGRVD